MPENDATQTSYDRIAEAYARRMLHELDHKPLDRELLERFAAQTAGKGRVADLGCGPGQIARYLHDHGVDAFGIDLSPAMIELARREHPGVDFQQGRSIVFHLFLEVNRKPIESLIIKIFTINRTSFIIEANYCLSQDVC